MTEQKTYCPRCDDYLDDENIEIDGEFVCAECVDDDELRPMVIRLQKNLRGRDAFLVKNDLWDHFTRSLLPAPDHRQPETKT